VSISQFSVLAGRGMRMEVQKDAKDFNGFIQKIRAATWYDSLI
jgi:hypothetical protein